MIGETLDHYTILSKLGTGGMGEVFVAEDSRLNRKVALKMLPSELAASPERRQRFEREAKAIAALNHPNIVVIHSVEEANDIHFITMELVEGKTLSELIPKDGFSLEKLFDTAVPLADAISSAHQKGITHRDLKPSNVMINDEGRAKILDFGLAKLIEEESDDASRTELPTEHLTEEGKVLGTLAYMSPEQAEGKPVDHRSDIFSFGILLYQMATGEAPFKGDTRISLISSIVKDTPVSITELKGTLPNHLGRIVRHSLEKDPERRYQSAKDLRNDLADLKQEVDSGEAVPASAVAAVTAPAASSPSATRQAQDTGASGSRERIAWLAVGALVVVVAVMGYFMTRGGGAAPAAAERRITIATGNPDAVYYAIGSGIAEVIEKTIPDIQVEVLPTDGSLENVKLLDRDLVELALVQNDVLFNSVKTDLVLGQQSANITALAVLFEEIAQILMRKDAGIETIYDLRGQRVNLDLPGSGSRFTSEIVLSHFGIDERDINSTFLTISEAQEPLLDGSMSVHIIWRALPAPIFEELFRTGEFELLSIDEHLIGGLRANQPFIVPFTIPALTYPNQPDEVSTIAVKATLAVSATLEDELIHDILDAIFSNVPDLIAHHPRAAEISADRAFRLEDGMAIELHPGAEQYWNSRAGR